VGRGPHRTRALPNDPRNLGDIQPGDDPQHDHLSLVLRQGGDQRQRCLGSQVVQRYGCGLTCGWPVQFRLFRSQPQQADGSVERRPDSP
jgi:hypothetical protein